VFKELEEWSSLLAISIVGMVDEEYGVRLNGSDISSCQTIEDLYNNVRAKM
jgi:Phosphopantetheine attachment site.